MGRNAVSTLRLASLCALTIRQHTKLTHMILRQSVEGRLVFALAVVAAHGGQRCPPLVEGEKTLHRRRHLFPWVGRCGAASAASAEREKEMLSALPTAGHCSSGAAARERVCVHHPRVVAADRGGPPRGATDSTDKPDPVHAFRRAAREREKLLLPQYGFAHSHTPYTHSRFESAQWFIRRAAYVDS